MLNLNSDSRETRCKSWGLTFLTVVCLSAPTLWGAVQPDRQTKEQVPVSATYNLACGEQAAPMTQTGHRSCVRLEKKYVQPNPLNLPSSLCSPWDFNIDYQKWRDNLIAKCREKFLGDGFDLESAGREACQNSSATLKEPSELISVRCDSSRCALGKTCKGGLARATSCQPEVGTWDVNCLHRRGPLALYYDILVCKFSVCATSNRTLTPTCSPCGSDNIYASFGLEPGADCLAVD